MRKLKDATVIVRLSLIAAFMGTWALFADAAEPPKPVAQPERSGDQGVAHTDVFMRGQEGYAGFRIPAIVVTKKGTILAICEGRKDSLSDKGNIDLVIRRSFDNGATWDAFRIIHEEGEETIGNPCPVVDRDTGIIWLPFCRNNKQVFVTSSRDDGQTWSKPVEITQSVAKPGWPWYATGPGHGIQLRSGRLLIPCDHRIETGPKKKPEWYLSHVFYSDDHGATWKLGGILDPKTDECEAVETENGDIYLNIRSLQGRKRRAVAWSKDGGLTWSQVKTDDTLIEPVCQAGLTRFTHRKTHGRNRVLFSNPASTTRENMTIRLSYDECRTWPVSRVLYPGKSAYSDLAVASDMTILCLYENGDENPYDRISLARFTLEWLTQGADRLDKTRVPTGTK